MGKPLIIVESPAKARTIEKYLKGKYKVTASQGHVVDLPKKGLAVDIENDFEPQYEIRPDKRKIVKLLKDEAKKADAVYLASDPDREGEAIAWHVNSIVSAINPNTSRVLFNEITPKGIMAGLSSPRELDVNLFNAQQARRILDRLVGYQLSPLLWEKIKRGLSAGRVQSVVLRIIVDREREILAFDPEEYWNLSVDYETPEGKTFTAKLSKIDGKKAKVKNAEEAQGLLDRLIAARHEIIRVERKEVRRNPSPPFITSTLLQDAFRKYRYGNRRTMALAQRLYEGVELGRDKEPVGLITYMRTDSVRVSEDAISATRDFISSTLGDKYLPEKPRRFKVKKGAQDAHEAIRPTDVTRTPEEVERLLKEAGVKDAAALSRLYRLIWRRFVASQMAPAVFDQTTVDVDAAGLTMSARGNILKFRGYLAQYEVPEEKNGQESEDDKKKRLPHLEEGWILSLLQAHKEQKFTQPPPRYSEASIVKEMQERGIGRPSTYHSIIPTLLDREYVAKDEGKLKPTDLGVAVTDLLVQWFPDIMDVSFTAQMEGRLDEIEEGRIQWRSVLRDFYEKFSSKLETAKSQATNLKGMSRETDYVCEKCGAPMVLRWNKGYYIACSNYPECRTTKPAELLPDGTVRIIEPEVSSEKCPKCSSPMEVRTGRFGRYLKCTSESCGTTMPYVLPYTCPKCGQGRLSERRTRKGKQFLGCTEYPNCDFMTWDVPVNEKCQVCGWDYMLKPRRGRKYCPKCRLESEKQ